MTTYLNKQFGAEDYARFRPSYPDRIYQHVLDYHNKHSSSLDLAVDLACGTGQATKALAKYANRVIGLDHSDTMAAQASKEVQLDNVEFGVAADNELDQKVKRGEADLLVIAEAAHYFHWPQFWEQAAFALKPGGTLAIWSYFLFSFPEYPEATAIIDDVAFSKDKCGKYWDSGVELLINNYEAVVSSVPNDQFGDIEYRVNKYDALRPDEPFELTKQDMPVGGLISLIKTWSPYFNWKRENPDKPDIADETMEKIHAATGLTAESKVTVKWSTVYLLATRK